MDPEKKRGLPQIEFPSFYLLLRASVRTLFSFASKKKSSILLFHRDQQTIRYDTKENAVNTIAAKMCKEEKE